MSDETGPDRFGLRVDRLAQAMDAARARAQDDAAPSGTDDASRPSADAGAKPKPVLAPVPPSPVDEPLILSNPVTTTARPELAAVSPVTAPGPSETDPPAPLQEPVTVPVTAPIRYWDQEADSETPKPAVASVLRMQSETDLVPKLLAVSGLKTDIGRYHILHGVDLEVPMGGVTMLLGRNGAGKTTTLRSIMGLWRAKAGKISLGGEDISKWRSPRIATAGIGYVPEDMGIFSDLTVAENMALAAISGRIAQDRLEWIFSTFPPLKTFWRSRAGNLSGGQKQMLSIARAMVEKRRLYLIDEPTKGLAPAIVSTMVGALRDLKSQGAAILMVEQNFAVAKALGDTCVILEDGRSIWAGEMAALAEDSALQSKLLGLSLESN